MIQKETLAKIDLSCREIIEEDQVVTFTEVARRAHVTRNSLYRNPELRQVVEEYRSVSRSSHTFIELSAQLEELRRNVELIADKVRHHEEQIRRLSRATETKTHGSRAG